MTEAIFQPANKAFRQQVIESFSRQQVMKTINVKLLSVTPGKVELEFPYQTELTQQHGFIHAGIVSTVVDSACGYAAFSLMPENAAVLTIEFKVNLLAPARGEHFVAVGQVKKQGRNITVTEGELFACTDNERKSVASMVGTIMAVYDREGVRN
ncbi:PaaI family thioesterase [Aliikangiella coralliicola]|uniref:PaaI family thioesterase n=1 Tax=Aliikangiella coralliicola TaxID=2592383 RepID=A0A545UFC2_9GAMM|nr:PaaI family thioesterase [Aliikangiella coralliicola]TQV88167.1 PaaI family thioesterase [Aliikangiella coralliicola]